MVIGEAFAIVLKRHRKILGLSQEKLASECNLDRTFISMLEKNKRIPTLNTFFTIAQALGIKSSDFIKEMEDEMEK